jgi:hypothetical protein
LGVGPLGPQPLVHFLGSHVKPVHDYVGMKLLESPLKQREEIAAVG